MRVEVRRSVRERGRSRAQNGGSLTPRAARCARTKPRNQVRTRAVIEDDHNRAGPSRRKALLGVVTALGWITRGDRARADPESDLEVAPTQPPPPDTLQETSGTTSEPVSVVEKSVEVAPVSPNSSPNPSALPLSSDSVAAEDVGGDEKVAESRDEAAPGPGLATTADTAPAPTDKEEKGNIFSVRKSKVRELQELRDSLKEKEVELLEKQRELAEKDQTMIVMKEQLGLEKKLRGILIEEKENAIKEAKLAAGLCSQGGMMP
ncbi:hypothetical protein HKI87_11g65110 [Chloropicon roscoffensis]|uniref:Uncharacterized protein n=1 Tax=Chloropicon roscoffensis TaxID=1461544 RepID=A0AAX4PGT8_9CHLO